ncbi:MAG: hypothetical protein AB7V46_20090 [Thermomicrobiales bacterium]
MNPSLFDQLESTLNTEGPGPAIARLCDSLRKSKDYNALFYALLMSKRHELGVTPVPTGPASDLPESLHPAYEEGIRSAAREVGNLHLAEGNIPQAWGFYRMIEEPQPIREAIEKFEPGDDDDLQPLVQIAFYEGLHPRKGFDWVLSRYGICSAITTVSGELPHAEEDKLYFVRALVRSLYHDLRDRLANEIEHRFTVRPEAADLPPDTPGVVAKLIADRDWLFADEAYHIDTSHLSSVVQMSMHLKPCLELNLARELCLYGQKLTGRFMGEDMPPFDNGYTDYEIYLSILAGDRVDEGLAHFRKKAEEADPDEVGTYPAEVLVNLLLKVGRGREAVEVAKQYLVQAEGRQLTCPDVYELCQRFKVYDVLAETAKKQGDVVHYLAGRIASGSK